MKLLSWPRWKLVACISEQAAAAAHQPMNQLTFLEPEQSTRPAPWMYRVKRKEICTSGPVAAIHISWGEYANRKWFVEREDTIWLLDLDGYDLFNQIPKAFECNGWVFSMFAQSATGWKLQSCDKRDIWPSAQPGQWNTFFQTEGI